MGRNVAIQHLRGLAANIPALNDGEFYLATNTGQLYVGLGGINFAVGGTIVATVEINGSANPTHFIEPNLDGSVNIQITAGTGVSLGVSIGKSLVMRTAQLTTTSVASQAILSYTVTAGKTLYLEYIDIQGRLTAVSATASVLGLVQLLLAGVQSYTATFVNPTTSDAGSQAVRLFFAEPLPIPAGTTILVNTTPAAVTSMLWTANLGGYEK